MGGTTQVGPLGISENTENLYSEFLKKWKEISLLSEATELLAWDQETGMPKGEGESRAEQIEILAGMIHEKMIDEYLHDILKNLGYINSISPLDDLMAANVREAAKMINCARALPSDLVATLAKETSLATEIWQKARKENAFSDFAPSLKKIIELSREKAAAYVAAGIGTSPYEALFYEYEDGITLAEIDAIFNKLRAELPPLVKTVLSLPAPDDFFLLKYYPKDLQEKVSREIVTAMGLDWNRCRLDVTTHPFTCSPAYASPRITSRYDEKNLMDSIFSAIHEAGHALYEQGLPPEWAYQPIGAVCGLSIHESQSRFWEAWLGREHAFWILIYPKLRSAFPKQLKGITQKDFYRAVNKVKLGFIRTDSDLLTYNLHILLRYDIEKMMINDGISVNDIPIFWNELFEKYFGVEVPDDKRGCLQDFHWAQGCIGYFPTYTLGNIVSAQLYEKMENDTKLWYAAAYNNNFHAVREWLKERIHRHGSLYETQELVKIAIGQPISADIFMAQLKKRFGDVYNINLSS